MREEIKYYLYNSPAFELFGLQHNLSIFVSLLLWVTLPLYFKKYSSKQTQNKVGIILGYIVMSNYLAWVVLEIAAGTFSLKLHLPFHLCRAANILLPIVMITRNQMIYDIVYFWGLSGMLQGMFTPDITNAFPHFHFFRFWVGHNGLILAILYATIVYKMRPSKKGIKRAFYALNLFLFITTAINLILDSNYFWICGKPETASLLDIMGPWPWYILTGELVVLLHFFIAYAPFWYRRKRLKAL